MTLEEYNKIYSYPVVKQMQLTFSETGEEDIVLTNADICSEEMSLEESLCSDEDLRFGACEASCFKVRVVNSGSFKGKKLLVEQEMLVDDERYLIDSNGNRIVTSDGKYLIVVPGKADVNIFVGKYKVYSDEPSNDRMWRDLTCYDKMYEILNADVSSWYSALTFPMTIKALRDSFFTYLGITQTNVMLINDDFVTEGGFITEGALSGKTVIEAICELNGCFGHINRWGNFEYITLPSSNSITYRWYVDGSGKYEDYETEAITGITARAEATDVGTSVGTTDNVLIIENNPLIYGTEGSQELTTALTNLLGVVSQITYRPFNVDTYGNPMLPIGTGVTVNTKKYDPENGYTPFAVESFVKSRTLKGIQGLVDSISATGKPQRDAQVNNVQSQILRTKGKVHLLRTTVDELYSEIYDANTGIKSVIQQLSDEVLLKVNGAGRLVAVKLNVDPSSATSYATILADDINLDGMNITLNGTRGITITSPNFSVTSQGSITAKAGSIADWNISATQLYKEVEYNTTNHWYRKTYLKPELLSFEDTETTLGPFKTVVDATGIEGIQGGATAFKLSSYEGRLRIGGISKLGSQTWGATGQGDLNSAISKLLTSRFGAGTHTISGAQCFGFITSTNTSLQLRVPLSVDPAITSANVTECTIDLRIPSGGYVIGGNTDVTSYLDNSSYLHTQNLLIINLTKSNGWATNNIPVVGAVAFKVTFS